MSVAINNKDIQTAEAFWTLLKPLKKEIRQFLVVKLYESLKESTSVEEPVSMAEARSFVESLTAHSEMKVPSNEKGIYALVDEKY